jgi:hypothetical protein
VRFVARVVSLAWHCNGEILVSGDAHSSINVWVPKKSVNPKGDQALAGVRSLFLKRSTMQCISTFRETERNRLSFGVLPFSGP